MTSSVGKVQDGWMPVRLMNLGPLPVTMPTKTAEDPAEGSYLLQESTRTKQLLDKYQQQTILLQLDVAHLELTDSQWQDLSAVLLLHWVACDDDDDYGFTLAIDHSIETGKAPS